MTKTEFIPNALTLSSAELRLLEKYSRGDVSKTTAGAVRIAQRPGTAPVLLGNWQILLEALASKPESRLSELLQVEGHEG